MLGSDGKPVNPEVGPIFLSSSKMRRKINMSNTLIQARYNLDLMSMRLFFVVLSTVNPHFSSKDRYYDKEFKEVFISSNMLAQLLGGSKNLGKLSKICAKIEQAAVSPTGAFTFKTPDRDVNLYALFHHIEYKPREGLYAQLSNKLQPYIIDLLYTKGFTEMNLDYLLSLTSTYAIRLLQLLLQFQNIRRFKEVMEVQRTLTIEQLRFMLNVPETAYKGRPDNFKRHVIRIPVKEINAHTPYTLHFRPVRRGNKTVAFQFMLSTYQIPEETQTGPKFTNQAIDKLINLGFTEKAARSIFKHCDNSRDCFRRIDNALALFSHQQKNIKNRLGFLRKSIEKNWSDYYLTKNNVRTIVSFDFRKNEEFFIKKDGNELEPIELKPKPKTKRRRRRTKEIADENAPTPYSRTKDVGSRPTAPNDPPPWQNENNSSITSGENTDVYESRSENYYGNRTSQNNSDNNYAQPSPSNQPPQGNSSREGSGFTSISDVLTNMYHLNDVNNPILDLFPLNDYSGDDWRELYRKRFEEIEKLDNFTIQEKNIARFIELGKARDQHKKAQEARAKAATAKIDTDQASQSVSSIQNSTPGEKKQRRDVIDLSENIMKQMAQIDREKSGFLSLIELDSLKDKAAIDEFIRRAPVDNIEYLRGNKRKKTNDKKKIIWQETLKKITGILKSDLTPPGKRDALYTTVIDALVQTSDDGKVHPVHKKMHLFYDHRRNYPRFVIVNGYKVADINMMNLLAYSYFPEDIERVKSNVKDIYKLTVEEAIVLCIRYFDELPDPPPMNVDALIKSIQQKEPNQNQR